MMMGFQFLMPLIAAVLYVIVFQKAGFRGPILAVAAGPILGALLTHGMYGLMGYYGPGVLLVSIPLGLLPLLVLAFKSWPPVGAAANSRSET